MKNAAPIGEAWPQPWQAPLAAYLCGMENPHASRLWPILVLLAALAFAAGPFLVPFNGFDPGLYPIPQENPPAQPAAYAFAIWGPIYLWLLVHAAFGLFSRAAAPGWQPARPALFVSLAIGASWLSVAMQSPLWATVLIWLMLAAALAALLAAPAQDRWLLREPIGLYAGWLTAASAVSLALLGAGYGALFSQWGWAAAAIALAAAIAVPVTLAARSVTYPLGAAWALVAIAVRNGAGPIGIAALLLALALLALAARAFVKSR